MSVTTKPERESDEAILHRLGYAQVLYREMGGFSNFAISFTIISILAGCLTSYIIAWNNGGPVAITWGWLLVGAFCVLVALAMGEIASAMPTAGALYFWASKLGGPAWGWFTGWFNLVGQIAVTASIDYGAATFTTALLNLWFPDAIGTDTGAVFITFTVIMALHLGLNLFGVNLLAMLNSISAWWHMVGVVVIVVILWLVPTEHQTASFVFGETINNSGFGGGAYLFVFGIGLLMSQYTVTGYDASAHMSEETRQASRTAAIGMVMAVVASVVFGFVLLVAVTFAATDVEGATAAGANIVIYIWTHSVGNTLAAFLLIIAVVAQFFCGTASVTSASRMLFAFSRDGAVPFSKTWRKVATNRVPTNAVIIISVLSWALMIPTLANGIIGYQVGTSIAVIGLYIAFALPIILRIRAGAKFQHGAWSLGNHYKWIAPLAVVWIAIVCVLFLMPTTPAAVPWSEDFSWEALNYAPITVGAALIGFGGWFLLSAKKWFTGPVREAGTEEELAAIEHNLEGDTTTVAAAAGATAAAGAAATAVLTKPDTAEDTTTEADAKADEAETATAAESTTATTEATTGDAAGATAGDASADTTEATEVAETPAEETADATVTEEAATKETATEEPAAAEAATTDAATTDAATTEAATEEAAAEEAPAAEAVTEEAAPAEAVTEEPAAEAAITEDAAAPAEAATDEPATAEATTAEATTAEVTTDEAVTEEAATEEAATEEAAAETPAEAATEDAPKAAEKPAPKES